MKKIFTILFALMLTLAIGCGKSDKTDKTDGKDTKKDEKKTEFVSGFTCKIDGKEFTLPDSICYARKDDKSFTIYAKIDIEKGQYDDFFFFFETQLKTGDFNISKENKPGHVQYRTNKNKPADAEYIQYWSDAGKLTITKVDDKSIEGTFSFTATATEESGAEKKMNITDGKLKVKIN